MKIAVIDSMGGSIGNQIITQLRQNFGQELEIFALGTNAIATSNMLKAKANRGATGENAIKVTIEEMDLIFASISVIIANSMMGEITPTIAESIRKFSKKKIFIPLCNPPLDILGVEKKPLPQLIDEGIKIIKEMIDKNE
ncbi:MAG: DUF3842 family protein [Actinobacteria bacterium]|nr:DUF3842 family protein [Actinomycetota bacterium]